MRWKPQIFQNRPGRNPLKPLSPTGLVFTVRAEARTASGAAFVREAVARLSSDPGEIMVFYTWKVGKRRPAEDEDAS